MGKLDDLMSARDLDVRWERKAQTGRLARTRGTDPAYLKLGGRVFYRVEDVLAYEAARRFTSTTAASEAQRARSAA